MKYHPNNEEALAIQNEALRRRNGELVYLIQYDLGPDAQRIANERGLIPPPEGDTHFSKIKRLIDRCIEMMRSGELSADHDLAELSREVDDYYRDGAQARREVKKRMGPVAAMGREAKKKRRDERKREQQQKSVGDPKEASENVPAEQGDSADDEGTRAA